MPVARVRAPTQSDHAQHSKERDDSMTHLVLPRLRGLRIQGVEGVYTRTIDRAFPRGLNLILGGNGLGKTTAAQAIVFGLTGGPRTPEVEPLKAFRWDHKWFAGRVRQQHLASATVEVDFDLGKRFVSLRRRFDSHTLRGVRIGSSGPWRENSKEAEAAWQQELAVAGYRSHDDFSFLVTRLLYLAENRRLIAWDPDAQARILMLLNPDAINEHDFRGMRADLKLKDSARRHAHVLVGKLQPPRRKDNEDKSAQVITSSGSLDLTDDAIAATPVNDVDALRSALLTLETADRQRQAFSEDVTKWSGLLAERSNEIDELRAQIDQSEASLVAESLAAQDATQSLPLAALAEHGTCPACGTYAAELQARAQAHTANHQCSLCGSKDVPRVHADLFSLNSQVREKLRAQREANDYRRRAVSALEIAQLEYDRSAELVSRLRRQLEDTALHTTPGEDDPQRASPPSRLRIAERREAELLADVTTQRGKVHRTYTRFMNNISDRVEELRELYAKYATVFLGMDCELADHKQEDRLFSPQKMVPRFAGVIRDVPETCSEAQQFFLDIAFRMAVLDWNRVSGSGSTFLCETPENALDMSYLENVVQMFRRFANHGHTTILTANIRPQGLAQQLVASYEPEEYESRVLQLLEIGRLSSVQKRGLEDLRKNAKPRGPRGR